MKPIETNSYFTGDPMKHLIAFTMIVATSIGAHAYSENTFNITEFRKLTCQLSGHGITDVTHGFIQVGDLSKRATGEHISRLFNVSVLASWDRDYSPDGPRAITELAGSITNFGQYAGTSISQTLKADGQPDPTVFTFAYESRQLDAIVKGDFKRTGTNGGYLTLTYQNYDDAQKILKFSGACTAN